MAETAKSEKNQLDSSLSLKKTLNSTNFRNNPSDALKKESKNAPPKKGNKDELNNWEYCNPENVKDQLPQPYRFINKVLDEMILNPVYQSIFEIEKHKSNPNYEGSVKEIPPQGSYEYDGISYITKDRNNPNNHLLAGDKYGNIYILDLNKKTQLYKREGVPGKRVICIDSVTTSYSESYLTTFVVVSRAEPVVQIYRYVTKDNRAYIHFNIRVTKDYTEECSALDFPREAVLSHWADFVAITTYRGNVLIYKIPDPPTPIVENQDEVQNTLLLPGQPQQSKTHRLSSQSSLEIKSEDIKDIYYKIEFAGNKKNIKYEDLLKKIENETINKLKEDAPPADPKAAAKDAKKDAKKGGKAQEVVQEEQKQPDVTNEIEFNPEMNFPKWVKGNNGADITNDVAIPKYRPIVFFLKETIVVPNSEKLFNKIKSVKLTTSCYIMWTNTKFIERHILRKCKPEYLAPYIYNDYFADPKYPKKQEEERKALPPPEKKLFKKSQVIYPISVAAINESECYLGIGLKDGTVLIWDTYLEAERGYLDKHQLEVTCINFMSNHKAISGSLDGGVHVYNVEKSKLEMKRTNLFKEKKPYSIINIQVSESGVAFVMDSLQNLRMYDMYHSDKIARHITNIPGESRINCWQTVPNAVMNAQKEQLCIVAELRPKKLPFEEEGKDQQQQNQNNQQNYDWNKQTNIQIFRIFDGLINIFPGLQNVFRKGVDKDKIINLFSRISMKELKDNSFDIPQLLPQATHLMIPVDGKSRQSRSIGRKSESKVIINQLTGQQGQLTHTQKSSSLTKTLPQQLTQTVGQTQTKQNLQGSMKSQVNAQTMQQAQRQSSIATESEIDLNSSFKTQLTQVSSMKQRPSMKTQGLTKEALHPEEFYFEKVKIPAPELVNETKQAIEQSRLRNEDRSNEVASTINKINSELQAQDEKRHLLKQKELLKKIKDKK